MSRDQDTTPVPDLPSLGWQLFESSPDCIALLGIDGRILAMNGNGRRALDIDEFAAVAGTPWQALWPDAQRDEVDAAVATAARGGAGRFAAPCRGAAGARGHWDVVVTAVDAGDGRADCLLAVARDVGAAHAAQRELRASEARFRTLVLASSEIMWHGPSSGRFDAEQPAWSAFTGQSFEQYRDFGWLDAIHPDDREATRQAWARAVATGVYETRQRLRRADGIYRHMRVKAVPVSGEEGAVADWVGVHTDVTDEIAAEAERERLLKEVQAAHARMNDIFRQAPAFMCVLRGPEHVFELINDRYLQLVGNRDLVGQPLRAALPEIAGQGYLEILDRVYSSGEPFVGTDMPALLQREPGMPLEARVLDLVYLPLRDADGRVTGLLAHGVDQTSRKQAEDELYESRERFRKIVSQAATGVVEMDTRGTITFANRKYADMLGYSPEELVGRNVIDVTAPDSVRKTLDTVGRLLVDGIEASIDKHYLRKDGSLMPATSSVNALRGPDGEFQGVVAIVLDTTESKRAAEELRASEERYRTLFESMDQGFCIIEMILDAGGRPVDYRFIEMNAMFERHTGLAGASGKTALELVPDLDAFWFDTYGRVALSGEPVRFESGSEAMGRWFDVYATRIGAAASLRVALLFSDISARKAADGRLRRLADDLSEADRRKTEFLATLAHELRNPLAPIRSGLSVMRLSGDNAAAVAKVRDMMERQVGHMVHLIDDLLDIARISGGKLELKRARVDLHGVLASAIETSLPMIEAGQHDLRVDVPDGALEADVDFTRIAQVVANLLNNAAKYTPAGGRIDLVVRREDDVAAIAVADSGIGIPAEELAGVFEMFSQVGRHLDRSQGGLGIGLSLVRRLVEMHGGSVTAASAGSGAGSTFTVRLPLAPDRAQADAGPGPAVAAAPEPAGGGIAVLVVDDNVDAALTLSMILELHGHTVRTAHDGVEALEVAAGFAPRLVFLDIGMPRMNGYETARAMRKMAGLRDAVLVALTGWGAEEDRSQSSEAGFDRHLTKPVQMGDIEKILADIE